MTDSKIVKKVYVSEDNTAVIICESCGRQKRLVRIGDEYSGRPVRVHCTCGSVFFILLERRRYFRKNVDLPGLYLKPPQSGEKEMFVRDISLGGLRFETVEDNDLREGDIIRVRFRLDDPHRTKIDRSVVVRYVRYRMVGVEYFKDDPNDRALGAYLRP